MNGCSGMKNYECLDGTCGYSEYSCKSPVNSKCDHYQFDFLCPNGECAKSDAGCLRPCGTNINGERYQYPCDGFAGCIASNGHGCPAICEDPMLAKCANQKCVRNERFCVSCNAFRCDNGDCTYSYMDKCNEIVDCADGSDEWDSTCEPYRYSNNDSTTAVMPVVIIGVIFFFFIVIVIAIVLVVVIRRRRMGYGESRSSTGRAGQAAVVTSGVQPQAIPMTSMPPNLYHPQAHCEPNIYQPLPCDAPPVGAPYQQPPHPYGAQYGQQYPGYDQPTAAYQPVPQSAPSAPPGMSSLPPSYDVLWLAT